mmetsp:Transcript_33141/g.93556  ORF Transcript_33141/g.93556 Transcript_33141/m.93556 type:complete len:91 (+) Transcript_33141:44-316(+)
MAWGCRYLQLPRRRRPGLTSGGCHNRVTMEAEKMGAALIQDCKAGKERESVLAFHNLFVALLGRRSTHVAFGLEGEGRSRLRHACFVGSL